MRARIPRRRRLRAIRVAALTLSCLLFVGCKPSSPTAVELPAPKVTTVAVISQETVDADEYTGRTEASEIVEVRARVYGYLHSIDFKDGDFVKEGDPLFTIESDEYEAIHRQSLSKIEVFTARLELNKAKLARNEKLVKSGAVTREEYEETIAAVRETEAQIVAAKADAARTALDVKYTAVKAPINGRIDRALTSKGNLLTGGMTSGTLLTKIVNEQPMHVYFDVDEQSLLRYMKQRPAVKDEAEAQDTPRGSLRERELACYVMLADEREFTHEGKLDFASSEVNASTGTARIRGVFPNAERAMASGLFVRVRIPVSKPYRALFIPERALATDQNIKFVYVVKGDGTVERRSIELGALRGDLRIVTAGLQEGEQVVVKGLQRVRPGQKVEAEEAKSAPAPSKSESESHETKPAS